MEGAAIGTGQVVPVEGLVGIHVNGGGRPHVMEPEPVADLHAPLNPLEVGAPPAELLRRTILCKRLGIAALVALAGMIGAESCYKWMENEGCEVASAIAMAASVLSGVIAAPAILRFDEDPLSCAKAGTVFLGVLIAAGPAIGTCYLPQSENRGFIATAAVIPGIALGTVVAVMPRRYWRSLAAVLCNQTLCRRSQGDRM